MPEDPKNSSQWRGGKRRAEIAQQQRNAGGHAIPAFAEPHGVALHQSHEDDGDSQPHEKASRGGQFETLRQTEQNRSASCYQILLGEGTGIRFSV